ncbi:MAG: thiamine biosynthesis protein ThiS [Hyphomicrobiales bacterium]|jgi:sulfur carrier protein|nr:thiamine biosynthesis protein ThiS [Hyphomicrobiales bacterium]
MKVIVNGQSRELSARTLEDALVELGFENAVVATAVNGDFVRKGARAVQSLADGDRLEVLAPMQGG